MRQTLFYIPSEIFGPFFPLPLFGFGILFWAILIYFGFSILRSREKLWENVPAFFVALLFVYIIAPAVSEEQGFPIRGYGVFLLIGVVAAASLMIFRSKNLKGITPDLLLSLAATCVISGIIGARVFHVIEYWPNFQQPSVWESAVSIINLTKGGLVVYGGIIFGTIGAIVFTYRHKLPMLVILDLAAPALALGIAFGRLGCLMNGCCFGNVCDAPMSVTFPAGSPAHVHQILHNDVYFFGIKLERDNSVVTNVELNSEALKKGMEAGTRIIALGRGDEAFLTPNSTAVYERLLLYFKENPKEPVIFITENVFNSDKKEKISLMPTYNVLPVFPTQIYSSIGAFLLCGVLLIVARYAKTDGVVALSFFGLYAVFRFLIEIVRNDESSFLGTGLTISQNISLLVLFATILCVWQVKGVRSPEKNV